jgi:hypothetical protein
MLRDSFRSRSAQLRVMRPSMPLPGPLNSFPGSAWSSGVVSGRESMSLTDQRMLRSETHWPHELNRNAGLGNAPLMGMSRAPDDLGGQPEDIAG